MGIDRPLSVRDVAGYRVAQTRKRRGMYGKDLAARCAQVGAAHVTRDFVTSLETRRRGLSVDDWLVLAYALDVPPLSLLELSAQRDEAVAVAPQVVVGDAEQWRNWLVGDAALEGTDERLYYGAALEQMQAPSGQAVSAYTRTLVQERYRQLAAQYEQHATDLLARTRAQALALLDDVAADVRAGTSSEEILRRLDRIRANIVQNPPAPTTDPGGDG